MGDFIKPQVIKVNAEFPEMEVLEKAAAVINSGGLVAFPTETVYGLGADGLNDAAVRNIFRAKGRPADNPLILHVGDLQQAQAMALDFPEVAQILARKFWPGPLTLVLRSAKVVPKSVTAGLETVAVRVPAHPVALGLIRVSGKPIAAPSANVSGRLSPTTAEHVAADLDGRVDLILDGGKAWMGLESTVVDVTGIRPVLLRPGAVSLEQLQELIGPVEIYHDRNSSPKSPGLKHVHYCPAKARLILVEGSLQDVVRGVLDFARSRISAGLKVGIMATQETRDHYKSLDPDGGWVVATVGSRDNLESVSKALFETLRDLDNAGVDEIICEGLPEHGLGRAIMDRLRRAATLRLEV